MYDGACPLCSREIAWYQRRQLRASVHFLDVSQPGCPLPGPLTQTAALARFHVLRGDGHLLSGAEAFVCLWSQTPGLAGIASLLRRLRLVPFLEWGYRRFLPLRGWLARTFFRHGTKG